MLFPRHLSKHLSPVRKMTEETVIAGDKCLEVSVLCYVACSVSGKEKYQGIFVRDVSCDRDLFC